MKQKTEPEQMRLIEETQEEKIAKLRQRVDDREKIYKAAVSSAKEMKDMLAAYVFDHCDGFSLDLSEEVFVQLQNLAVSYRSLALGVLEAKSAIGEACAELAKAERSR